MSVIRRGLSSVLVVGFMFFAVDLSAQVARVFLSGTGNDLNDCSDATTPCRSLQGAVNQCPVSGVVIVMATGGYGTANITKSLTINTPSGVVAFVARTITVNIGSTDKVVIRGLTMNGSVFGDTNGIAFTNGGTLVVENSNISGFGYGISHSAVNSNLVVRNCDFRRNLNSGVDAGSAAGGPRVLTVENCRFDKNGIGVHVWNGTAVIKRSVATGNSVVGYSALADGGYANPTTNLLIDDCVSAQNSEGIRVSQYNQATVAIRVTNSTITGNSTGLSFAVGSGTITSYGTNHLWGNTSDGSFTSTVARQ
ncbi:MAG: hypothetical protein DMF57_00835 [Acidobacteria bacterium]|nr:MAG: hypothetical protein DMF57_00835 [Acidobacteriota bacterium]